MIGMYRNGNYLVAIFRDGTKMRFNNEESLIPAFAESHDIHITNKCDGGCKFCYAGCVPMGEHGDILTPKLLETLHPYTELAINGNDMSHPNLVPFLRLMKEKKIIVNLTVNQIHFEYELEFIRTLANQELIHGIGVSLNNPTPEFIEKFKEFPNGVLHVINGILTEEQVSKIADKDLKILILGYKELKRGVKYYAENTAEVERNKKWLYDNLESLTPKFNVISFDNLALEQLDVKRLVSADKWEEIYMGDDGDYTFYIDLVDKTFAKDSMSPIKYPLMDSVDEMFEVIRRNKI